MERQSNFLFVDFRQPDQPQHGETMFDIPLTASFLLTLGKNPDTRLFAGVSFTPEAGRHGRTVWVAKVPMPWSMKQHAWLARNYIGWQQRNEVHRFELGRYSMREIADALSSQAASARTTTESPLFNRAAQANHIRSILGEMDAFNCGYIAFVVGVDAGGADAWRIHEGFKYFRGIYDPVPPVWLERDFIADTALDPKSKLFNFPHVSVNNPGILAFTADDTKGRRDIQTPMKPGKYLKQFLGDKLIGLYGENKANAIIAQMAAEFGNYTQPETLKFAATADEIEYVYTHGPSSCMSHMAENFSGSEHPVRAFAAGDLQVAYIERKKEQVTARALVWPEKKVMTRIYGDKERIFPLLSAAGYKYGTARCLDGARLAKIEDENHRGHFVMPYIDGHVWAKESDDKSHFILDTDNGYSCVVNTNGICDLGFECWECKKRWRTNAGWNVRLENTTRLVCQKCYEKHTMMCSFSGQRYLKEDMVEMAWGGHWFKGYFRDYGFTCAFDGLRHSRVGDHEQPSTSRRDQRVLMQDGHYWFFRNFEAHGKRTKDGRNITLTQWEAEEKTRMMRELESEGQLSLEGMSPEEMKKKIAAKKRREQRAAKRAEFQRHEANSLRRLQGEA